jgi:hypothetical protein
MILTPYTHISVIVDRSGSMAGLEKDMIGGLKEFFRDQAKIEGICKVDYAQFDTEYEEVFTDTLVASAKPVLEPRGMTALHDALGKNITNLKTKFKALPKNERPDNVIVIVVTDGGENSSREFSGAQVKELVEKRRKKDDWQFVFLGANQDAVTTGGNLGFSRKSSMTYDTANTASALRSVSTYAADYRMAGAAAFTDSDREEALNTN